MPEAVDPCEGVDGGESIGEESPESSDSDDESELLPLGGGGEGGWPGVRLKSPACGNSSCVSPGEKLRVGADIPSLVVLLYGEVAGSIRWLAVAENCMRLGSVNSIRSDWENCMRFTLDSFLLKSVTSVSLSVVIV